MNARKVKFVVNTPMPKDSLFPSFRDFEVKNTPMPKDFLFPSFRDFEVNSFTAKGL